MTDQPTVMRAPLTLEYPFTRTTGPVVGAFLTGLREGMVLGIKRADGTVLVPPTEYDPITSDPLHEMVEVGQTGTVVTWTWNAEVRPQQPFDQPFAWALIQLDGADTPMLHGVLVDSEDQMSSGMRVSLRWREEREGHIGDIAGFVPNEQDGFVPNAQDGFVPNEKDGFVPMADRGDH